MTEFKPHRPCNTHKEPVLVSTGICGSTTFGHGKLDDYGYWKIPCAEKARELEKSNPEFGKCWPFGEQPKTDKVKKIVIYKAQGRIQVYSQRKNSKGRFVRDKLLAERNLELIEDKTQLAKDIGDIILKEANK